MYKITFTTLFFCVLIGCKSKNNSLSSQPAHIAVSVSQPPRIIRLYAVDSIFHDYLPDTNIIFKNPEELRQYYFSNFKKFEEFCDKVKRSSENRDSGILSARQAEILYQDLMEVNYMKVYKNWEKDNQSMSMLSSFSPYSRIIDLQERINIFKTFPVSIQNNEVGKKTWKRFQEYLFDKNIGLNFHEFDKYQIHDGNNKVKIEDIFYSKYKYYILVFGASWCLPCRLEELQLKYWNNNIDTSQILIVGLSIDRNEDKWNKYLNDDKLPWKCYLLEGEMNNEMVKKLRFEGIPRNFLLDENGKIVGENTDIRKILKIIPVLNTQ